MTEPLPTSFEGCTPVQFFSSTSDYTNPSKEESSSIMFKFSPSSGENPPGSVIFLVALFVVYYRRTGVEDAALGILDQEENSAVKVVRLRIDPDATLSSIVKVAIDSIRSSTSGEQDFEVSTIISTSKREGRIPPHGSSDPSLEWQIGEDNRLFYDQSRHSQNHIQILLDNVLDAAACIVNLPQTTVGKVPFTSVIEQLERVGVSTATPPSPSYSFTTLRDAFTQSAAANSERTAVDDGETALTYAELDLYSSALALKISEALVGRNDTGFISWCIPPSPLAIIVILGIIKYGAAYVPLDIRLPNDRLNTLISDSGACLLLTTSDSPVLELDNPESVGRLDITGFLDEIRAGRSSSSIQYHPRSTKNNLAYVMYTSGSTGKPKGVCIDDTAVLSLVYDRGRFQLGPEDRVAQINNLAWDGSIFDVWCTLLTGATLVSFSHYDILEPTVLAKQFHKLAVNATFITTSLFRQILNVAPDLFERLRFLLCGGESIDYEQYRKLYEINPTIELFNMYGPTETCCYTTSYIVPMDNLPQQGVVPIGVGLEHTQCLVVDSEDRLVPPGVIGELVIGGRGVGVGYLGRPKETEESFVELEFEELGQAKSRFYRSGDLVRWLPNGELLFEGRRQAGQVKIRGQRLEVTEVEASCVRTGLISHAAVAYVKPADGRDSYLTSYLVRKPSESGDLPTLRQILTALKSAVPSYMVPKHVNFVETLPLTNSGKLDRRAIQAIAVEAGSQTQDSTDHDEEYIAPQSDLERRICEIYSEVLPDSSSVGATSDFFDIGGHSLLAMRLKWRLQQTLHGEVSMRDIFAAPTPRELATRIEALGHGSTNAMVDLSSYPVGGLRPLTLGELRFWNADKENGGYDPVMACPHWVHIDGSINEDVLEMSIVTIVQRQDIFRTVFSEVDGAPRGRVVDFFGGMETIDVDLDLDRDALEDFLRSHARRPFKVDGEVLFRSILFRIDEEESILLFSCHHMITDGYSRDILFQELSATYNSFIRHETPSLQPLPVQYEAFAHWHASTEFSQLLETQSAHWIAELDNAKAAEFPLDYPRPSVRDQRFDAGMVSFVSPPDLTWRLEALCKEVNITMYTLLITVLRLVHYQLTQDADACIASSIANRTRPEAESICGYFVNILAYRIKLDGRDTVKDIFAQVRRLYLGAIANQDVSFPKVSEKLGATPDKPLTRNVMGYHHFNVTSFELGEASARPMNIDMRAFIHDITVFVNREGDEMVGDFHYRKDLFKEETVRGIVDRFSNILQVLAGGGGDVGEILRLTLDDILL